MSLKITNLILKVIAMTLFSSTSYSFTLACSDGCQNALGWNATTLEFDINDSSCPAGFRDELVEAMQVWNDVDTTGLRLAIGETTNESASSIKNAVDGASPTARDPIIVCDPDFATTFGFSSSEEDVVAGASNIRFVNGDNIDAAYVIFNVQSGAGANIENASAVQRKIVAAHEIGHALGLGHSEDQAALMFFDIGSKANLNLSQDDADGLSYFYPSNEPSGRIMGCGLTKAVSGASASVSASRIIADLGSSETNRIIPNSAAPALLLFFLPLILAIRLRPISQIKKGKHR